MVAGGRDVTSRRPTIRLGYVLELVATAALCFGLMRFHSPRMVPTGRMPASGWVRFSGGALLTAMTFTNGIGLVLETIRGRRPVSWGLGRWIWSIAVLFLAFSLAGQSFVAVTQYLRVFPRSRGFVYVFGHVFEWLVVHPFFGGSAWAIAAVCATSMLAGSPRDPKPDAREWAGRVFASLAVALNIAEPLMRAAGR